MKEKRWQSKKSRIKSMTVRNTLSIITNTSISMETDKYRIRIQFYKSTLFKWNDFNMLVITEQS